MKSNIGTWTRFIRALIGVVIIGLYLFGAISGVMGYVLLGVATLMFITSAIAFCPAASICPISRALKLFGLE